MFRYSNKLVFFYYIDILLFYNEIFTLSISGLIPIHIHFSYLIAKDFSWLFISHIVSRKLSMNFFKEFPFLKIEFKGN